MQIKIKELSEMKMIGVKNKCNMNSTMEEIPPLWDKLMSNKNSIMNKVNDKISYGICTMVDNSNFFYNACFEVSDINEIPNEMKSDIIPEMKVAVFLHEGKVDLMKDTYEKIMKEYIPNSDIEIDFSKPCIEMYDERFKYDSNDSICEIWMPIK